MLRSKSRYMLICCLISLVGVETGWAQRITGSIGGVIQDSSGAVVPGANIQVTNQGTGVERSAQSNEVGAFQVPFLQPGNYTLRIEAPGFRAFAQTNIVVESARDIRSTYSLQVGDITETITVESEAALVSIVSSEQRTGLARTQLAQLPTLNRNVTNLLTLSPGVQVGAGGESNRSIRLSGMGGHATGYTVDGVEATGQADGRQMSTYGGENRVDLLGGEAIEEVQIIKGVVPAEYSNTLAGQINIITKSGTSQVHGSLFHLYQGARFNAQDPFLASAGQGKPNVVYNQYGGSVGFPIVQNRSGLLTSAFGYFTYEGYRELRNRRRQTNTATQLARDVLLSSPHFDSRERQILDLALSETPLPNQPETIDDETCMACGGQTGLSGQYITAQPEIRDDDTFMFKGDLHLKDGSAVALTWNRMTPFSSIPGIVPLAGRTYNDTSNRYGVNWYKGAGPWSFETRFGYTWITQDRLNAWLTVKDPTDSEESFPFEKSVPSYGVSGLFTTIGGELRTVWSPIWNLDMKVGYLKSNHSLKWGGQYRYQAGGFSNPEGAEHRHDNFERLYNNLPPTSLSIAPGQPFHDSPSFLFGFFLQDDWKVRRNFTLNLGFRYDFISAPRLGPSKYDKYPTGRDQQLVFLNLAPPTDWQAFDFGGVLFTKPLADDAYNFSPRVGFNWDLSGEGRTVIRGGVASMYAPVTQGALKDSIADLFVGREITFTTADNARFGHRVGTFTGEARQNAVALATEGGFNPQAYVLVNPDMRAPYSMTGTFGIQRSISRDSVLEVDYVVQRGVHLPMLRYVNPPDRVTGIRPNPDLLATFYLDDSQQSFYNGLQTGFRKRFSQGFLYAVSYTFGKTLAYGGGDVGHSRAASDNFPCCQDFHNTKLSRGRTPSDFTHNFTSNWYYELPTPAGPAGTVLGGFTVSGILRARTGLPIGVIQGRNGGRGRQLPDIVVNDVAQAKLPGDYRETLRWWDPDAFAEVPSGAAGVPIRNGNANRTLMEGPGYWTVDLSVAKNFRITETARLQFRWDFLNAFNHVNYSTPRNNITSSGFGEIRGAGSMRRQQLNLRLDF